MLACNTHALVLACRLMDMLQQPALTKRLLFCLLEAFLIKIFPDNKFKELFAKLHDH